MEYFSSDHQVMVRKSEMLQRLREAIRELGIDSRNSEDNSILLNALCDLMAMMIAATAADVEAATRTIGREALPQIVAYFQQSPESSFWLRKPN